MSVVLWVLACLEHLVGPLLGGQALQYTGAAHRQLWLSQQGHQRRDCILIDQQLLAVGLLSQAMQLPELVGAAISVGCDLRA